ncbi:hypothetical protein IC582_013654 [Cucumis melo]
MKKDSSPLMKKDNSMNPNLKLLLPPPDEVSFAFITRSGTFTDGDLLVNKDDVQIVSQTDDESVRNFELVLFFLVFFFSIRLFLHC